jgi:hypothetical protein
MARTSPRTIEGEACHQILLGWHRGEFAEQLLDRLCAMNRSTALEFDHAPTAGLAKRLVRRRNFLDTINLPADWLPATATNTQLLPIVSVLFPASAYGWALPLVHPASPARPTLATEVLQRHPPVTARADEPWHAARPI